jgi:hypothetical protein
LRVAGFAPRHLKRSLFRGFPKRAEMMRNLFRTILVFAFVGFSASAVYPCSCEFAKPSKKLREAKAVFVGEVLEIRRNEKDKFADVAIRFKVERRWKGAKDLEITVVSARGICCTCGLPVTVGTKYLIYAYETEEGQIETSLCSSMPLERATEELTELGKGKKPKAKT